MRINRPAQNVLSVQNLHILPEVLHIVFFCCCCFVLFVLYGFHIQLLYHCCFLPFETTKSTHPSDA